MLTRVPVPTDNIYKFYALSGVLVLLTTLVLFFLRNDYYNARAFERYLPAENLKAKETLTPEEKRKLYWYEEQARIDEAHKDAELFFYLAIFLGFGFFLTSYGFHQWHTKIQPKQDRLLQLQIRKLELEQRAIQQTRFKRK
ncbi:hypothetical protein ACJJI5_05005 [Microbulbifer sp. EKSA008]|uniref:hypothetical protein n=1 Tax=Microbulbifer sp. EKSA008 TaxID=3243367 RepID=UPI004042E8C5